MAIPKSASKIGTLAFESGVRNALWTGRVGGVLAVWQVVEGGRARRMTGRKLAQLLAELDEALNEGSAHWAGDVNDAALDALTKIVRGTA